MVLNKYEFNKVCGFDFCQNEAEYQIVGFKAGQIILCKDCLSKLFGQIKKEVKNSEQKTTTQK